MKLKILKLEMVFTDTRIFVPSNSFDNDSENVLIAYFIPGYTLFIILYMTL